MRATQKIWLTVAVVMGILVLPPLLLRAWDATAGIRGMLAARRDLSHGHIAILAYGLPPGGRNEYARILKERYRIEYRQVALCIISPGTVDYADSYNRLSVSAAKNKFGAGVFEDTGQDAQRTWLHSTGFTPHSRIAYLFSWIPDKPRDPACFGSLQPGTSMKDVVEKCGRPDEDIGSENYEFRYHLPDGSTVNIRTVSLDSIQEVAVRALHASK
jgi:hypothetical protein